MKKGLNTFLVIGFVLLTFSFVSCPATVVMEPEYSTEDVVVTMPIHYYVDENGTDNGTGSSEKPFASMQKAVNEIIIHNSSYNGNSLQYIIHVSGTITGESLSGTNEMIIIPSFSSKALNITIVGEGESGGVLDAEGQTTKKRVLTLAGANTFITLGDNLVLTGGQSENGGGVYIGTDAVLTISGAEISGNRVTTGNGGGVYIEAGAHLKLEGSPKILNNTRENSSSNSGDSVLQNSNIEYEYSGTSSSQKGNIYITGALTTDAVVRITPELDNRSGYVVANGNGIPNATGSVTTYTIVADDIAQIYRDDLSGDRNFTTDSSIKNAIITALPALEYYVRRGGSDDVDSIGTNSSPFASVQRAVEIIKEIADGRHYIINVDGVITDDGGATNGMVSITASSTEVLNITIRGVSSSSIISADLDYGETERDAVPFGEKRVLYVHGELANITLGNNITLTGGKGDFGGGVYVSAGNVTITGATIEKNAATSSGGGIYVEGDATLRLQGSPVISNNVLGGALTDPANNVAYAHSTITGIGTIYITDALENANVSITTHSDESGAVIARGYELFGDDVVSSYTIKETDLVQIVRDDQKKLPFDLFNNEIIVQREPSIWYVKEASLGGDNDNDGKTSVTPFKTLAKAIETIKDFNDGRLYTIYLEGAVGGATIDSKENNGVLIVNLEGTGSGAEIDESLIIGAVDKGKNVVVTLQENIELTAGVVVQQDAKFIMRDSVIKGATKGVEVKTQATFEMTGGEICFNDEGVSVLSGAEMLLSGSPVVKNNGISAPKNVSYAWTNPTVRGRLYIVGHLTGDAHVGVTANKTEGGHVVATGANDYVLSDRTFAERILPDNDRANGTGSFAFERKDNEIRVPYPPTTYYVAPPADVVAGKDGSDDNPGTQTHPFATVQKAVKTIFDIGDARAYTIMIDGLVTTKGEALDGADTNTIVSIDSDDIGASKSKIVNITLAGMQSDTNPAILSGDFDREGDLEYGTHRVLYINGEDVTVTIDSSLTIAGGYHATEGGAGIFINSGTLNVDGIITGNASAAEVGAGVYVGEAAVLNISGNASIIENRVGGITADVSGNGYDIDSAADTNVISNISYDYTEEDNRGSIYITEALSNTIGITTPSEGYKGGHVIIQGGNNYSISETDSENVLQDGKDIADVTFRGFELSDGVLIRTRPSLDAYYVSEEGIDEKEVDSGKKEHPFRTIQYAIDYIKSFDDGRPYIITVLGAMNNDDNGDAAIVVDSSALENKLNITLQGSESEADAKGIIFPFAFRGSGAPEGSSSATEAEDLERLTGASPELGSVELDPHYRQNEFYGSNRLLYVKGEKTNLTLKNITLSGGKVVDQNGGAVYLESGNLTISSGAVIKNSISWAETANADAFGGGVYVDRGTLLLDGGTISNNYSHVDITTNFEAIAKGGGVYINNGTFNIKSGSINNNEASADTSTGYTDSDYSDNVLDNVLGSDVPGADADADIDAFVYGAGVYVENGSLSMSGGLISANRNDADSASDAEAYGAGVYIGDGASFTMSDGEIKSNLLDANVIDGIRYGGGVYTLGTFVMQDGVIAENVFSDDTGGNNKGASIYVAGSTTRITGGTVDVSTIDKAPEAILIQ